MAPQSWAVYLRWDFAEQLKFFGGHLFAFLLGYYLDRTHRDVPTGWLLFLAAALLTTICTGTWFYSARSGDYQSGGFLSQNGGWELLLAGCLFLLGKKLLSEPRRHLRELPGVALAMPIYLMHNLLLSYLNWKGWVPDRFIEVLGLWTFVSAACYLLSMTLTTVPGLCYLCAGIRFRDACWHANLVSTFGRLFAKKQ